MRSNGIFRFAGRSPAGSKWKFVQMTQDTPSRYATNAIPHSQSLTQVSYGRLGSRMKPGGRRKGTTNRVGIKN